MPNLMCAAALATQRRQRTDQRFWSQSQDKGDGSLCTGDIPPPQVANLRETFFILNPDGDLNTRQAEFERWFSGQMNWSFKVCTMQPLLLLIAATCYQ